MIPCVCVIVSGLGFGLEVGIESVGLDGWEEGLVVVGMRNDVDGDGWRGIALLARGGSVLRGEDWWFVVGAVGGWRSGWANGCSGFRSDWG